MNKNIFCTDKNILVKEFVDSETESGIYVGESNNEPYSLYEVLEVNKETLEEIAKVMDLESIEEKDFKEKYLLLYSGFARVPITGNKFIVHLKDCLAIIDRKNYKELVKD